MKTIDSVLHSSVNSICLSQKAKRELENRTSVLLSLFEERENEYLEILHDAFPGAIEQELESQLLSDRKKLVELVLGKKSKGGCKLRLSFAFSLIPSFFFGALIFTPFILLQIISGVVFGVFLFVDLFVLLASREIASACDCDFHILMRLLRERDSQREVSNKKEKIGEAV